MSRGSLDDLGDLQKAVMEIVWSLGEASVNQVRAKLGRSSLRQFINRVCGGDPIAMFQHLLDDHQLSADDLAELRKMIDKRRKELSDD